MRQIVLDTETTGLSTRKGDRIIEIGAVEIIDRVITGQHYHQYINPERTMEQETIDIHGISNEELLDKPFFAEIAAEFIDFVKGAELIIHNAPFDVGFINYELSLLKQTKKRLNCSRIEQCCSILDTLVLAKDLHPGQKNNLDALSRRYGINTLREFHGALLDSEILADVYLAMTGGQTSLSFDANSEGSGQSAEKIIRIDQQRKPLTIHYANEEELDAHQQMLALLKQKSEKCLWS